MKLRCDGCGLALEATADELPTRCPRAGDGGEHVLAPIARGSLPAQTEGNPFLVFRELLAVNLSVARVQALDAALAELDRGFQFTPLRRVDLGGPLWVKDETGNVAGSHKARHLMGLALHLEAAGLEVPLAIASCGNAALAAAVVAKAAGRPLEVFIPTDADPAVVAELERLEARITVCPRREGELGDPCYARFLEALAKGAWPFCCQGPANGLCLDGGKTLGFELAAQLAAREVKLDHLVVQVGGGALLSSLVRSLEQVMDPLPRIHAVQTQGAWPLVRAIEKARGADLSTVVDRSQFMWPWESTPHSLAHGILDDETYDWLTCARGVIASGGQAIAVDEETIAEARTLAQKAAPASATGAAGLAGVIELRRRGFIQKHEETAVILSGVQR